MGIREEKKAQTRQLIVENAWKLFSEYGYAKVKVSDIAKASNISVKTLFQYFSSKEDFIFDGQDELIGDILEVLKASKDPSHYLTDIKESIKVDLQSSNDDIKSKFGIALANMIAENPAISNRLSRLWLDYEHEVLNYLISITENPNTAKLSTISCKIILPYRLLMDRIIEILRSKGTLDIDYLIKWIDNVFSEL